MVSAQIRFKYLGGVFMRQFFITLFTPLARRFGWVHPNTLTILSLITGVLAGIALLATHLHPAFFIMAAAMIGLSGTCDSLDGIIARMNHQTTQMGDFLDHFFDRIVEIFIFVGLSLSPGANTIFGLLVIVLILLNGYLGTQIEASFGQRYYGGGGKAELFVALVLGCFMLGFWPGISLKLGQLKITVENLFFAGLCLATVISLVKRLLYVRHHFVGEIAGRK